MKPIKTLSPEIRATLDQHSLLTTARLFRCSSSASAFRAFAKRHPLESDDHIYVVSA